MTVGNVKWRVKKRPPPPAKVVGHMMSEAKKVGEDIGDQHIRQRERVIATWQGDTPSWSRQVDKAGAWHLTVFVFMGGHHQGIRKWKWLNAGTAIRFATMTSNFVAQTRVRVISSYKGRGGLLYINRRRPRPGIEARHFDETINKRLTKRFYSRLETVLIKAMKRKRF